jgi:hypothetical protein
VGRRGPDRAGRTACPSGRGARCAGCARRTDGRTGGRPPSGAPASWGRPGVGSGGGEGRGSDAPVVASGKGQGLDPRAGSGFPAGSGGRRGVGGGPCPGVRRALTTGGRAARGSGPGALATRDGGGGGSGGWRAAGRWGEEEEEEEEEEEVGGAAAGEGALALPRRPLLSVCVCSKMAARLVPRDTDAGPPPPTPPPPPPPPSLSPSAAEGRSDPHARSRACPAERCPDASCPRCAPPHRPHRHPNT